MKFINRQQHWWATSEVERLIAEDQPAPQIGAAARGGALNPDWFAV